MPKHSFQHGANTGSKIPVFNEKKQFIDGLKKTSFSAPSRTSNTLPPIVGGNGGGGLTGGQRGHSNPEKNKKYSKNPR